MNSGSSSATFWVRGQPGLQESLSQTNNPSKSHTQTKCPSHTQEKTAHPLFPHFLRVYHSEPPPPFLSAQGALLAAHWAVSKLSSITWIPAVLWWKPYGCCWGTPGLKCRQKLLVTGAQSLGNEVSLLKGVLKISCPNVNKGLLTAQRLRWGDSILSQKAGLRSQWSSCFLIFVAHVTSRFPVLRVTFPLLLSANTKVEFRYTEAGTLL